MKRLLLGLILVLVLFSVGCAQLKATSPTLTKNGNEIYLNGAKIVMISSNIGDGSRNEEDIIKQINQYLTRDNIEIISFRRFYDPTSSRLIRCEIIYRSLGK